MPALRVHLHAGAHRIHTRLPPPPPTATPPDAHLGRRLLVGQRAAAVGARPPGDGTRRGRFLPFGRLLRRQQQRAAAPLGLRVPADGGCGERRVRSNLPNGDADRAAAGRQLPAAAPGHGLRRPRQHAAHLHRVGRDEERIPTPPPSTPPPAAVLGQRLRATRRVRTLLRAAASGRADDDVRGGRLVGHGAVRGGAHDAAALRATPAPGGAAGGGGGARRAPRRPLRDAHARPLQLSRVHQSTLAPLIPRSVLSVFLRAILVTSFLISQNSATYESSNKCKFHCMSYSKSQAAIT